MSSKVENFTAPDSLQGKGQADSASHVGSIPSFLGGTAENLSGAVASEAKAPKVQRKSSMLSGSGIGAFISGTSLKLRGLQNSVSQSTLSSQNNPHSSASNSAAESPLGGAPQSFANYRYRHTSSNITPGALISTVEESLDAEQVPNSGSSTLYNISGLSQFAINLHQAAPAFSLDLSANSVPPLNSQITNTSLSNKKVSVDGRASEFSYNANWNSLSRSLQYFLQFPAKSSQNTLLLPGDVTLEELSQLVFACAKENALLLYQNLAEWLVSYNKTVYAYLSSGFDAHSGEFACYPELTSNWLIYFSSLIPLVEAIVVPSRGLITTAFNNALTKSGDCLNYPKLSCIRHPFNIKRLALRAFRDIVVVPLAPLLINLVEPITASSTHSQRLLQMFFVLSCLAGDDENSMVLSGLVGAYGK